MSTMHQYFVKIVPTVYKKLSGKVVRSNQYSFTKHQRSIGRPAGASVGRKGLPGFFVFYEIEPMLIEYSERRKSFLYFVTGVCAIVGGVFTAMGLLDALVYQSQKIIQRKIQLGFTK